MSKDFDQFKPILTEKISYYKEVSKKFNVSLSDLKPFFNGYISALEEHNIINNDCLLRSQEFIRVNL